MARANYQKETAEVRELLNAALRSFVPDTTNPRYNPQRYMLYVQGVVPWGERTRSSPAACRNALRRMLRRYMHDAIYSPRRRINSMTWDEWRRYLNFPINTVIKELETSGAVEYRLIDTTQAAAGIAS